MDIIVLKQRCSRDYYTNIRKFESRYRINTCMDLVDRGHAIRLPALTNSWDG
jgi:hypothetical protein